MARREEAKKRKDAEAKAAERLAVLVDAAERAALAVIDDAEKEARRYIEEAQAQADRIVAARLREVAEELESAEGAGTGGPRLRPVEAEPSAPRSIDEARADRGSGAARLLATQMAVAGSSREEIEARLRNGFDIEDTREILDAILGPEG
jgi:hypothetical protein